MEISSLNSNTISVNGNVNKMLCYAVGTEKVSDSHD